MRTIMRTHPLNVSYLVVGLIFLGLAGSWALRETGVIDLGEVRWLLPLTLVAAGTIGLVAFAAKGLGGRRPSEDDGYPTDTEGDFR
jgi:hypothetical protein